MKFDEKYTKYWSCAINRSVDGTKIAGMNEAVHFLELLSLNRHDRVLDMGCSFGRMHEAIAVYSDRIFGLEPDSFAVEQARLRPYKEVRQGSAEYTGFDSNFFELIFCWAVFDVVDHKKGLLEISRILKDKGKLLITGKNSNYFQDDELGFKAEKNAFLKGFPNRFTNLTEVLSSLAQFGLKLDKLVIFPRRGDFGLLNYIDMGSNINGTYTGYEYLMICHKFRQYHIETQNSSIFESAHSKTSLIMAQQAGFSSPREYFEFVGID